MSHPESTSSTTDAYQPQHPALRWLEKRLPIGRLIHAEFIAYPTRLSRRQTYTTVSLALFLDPIDRNCSSM
jgi:hypothetical protein